MDLTLFVIFIVLSFILIIIGLLKPEHSELSLLGFVFLFLLSLLILNSDIQYQTGEDVNISFSYDDGNLSISSFEEHRDVYDTFTMDGALAHIIGYWLALISAVGFVGVIIGLKPKEDF